MDEQLILAQMVAEDYKNSVRENDQRAAHVHARILRVQAERELAFKEVDELEAELETIQNKHYNLLRVLNEKGSFGPALLAAREEVAELKSKLRDLTVERNTAQREAIAKQVELTTRCDHAERIAAQAGGSIAEVTDSLVALKAAAATERSALVHAALMALQQLREHLNAFKPLQNAVLDAAHLRGAGRNLGAWTRPRLDPSTVLVASANPISPRKTALADFSSFDERGHLDVISPCNRSSSPINGWSTDRPGSPRQALAGSAPASRPGTAKVRPRLANMQFKRAAVATPRIGTRASTVVPSRPPSASPVAMEMRLDTRSACELRVDTDMPVKLMQRQRPSTAAGAHELLTPTSVMGLDGATLSPRSLRLRRREGAQSAVSARREDPGLIVSNAQ